MHLMASLVMPLARVVEAKAKHEGPQTLQCPLGKLGYGV